jgi:sterol 3beta-glucosyltransferase
VILDVEKSSAMDFSETIEIKVFDKEEHFSVDSYFFAYFQDLPSALDQIRDTVRAYRVQPQKPFPELVLDTTALRGSHLATLDRSQSLPNADHVPKSSSTFKITSLLRPFHDTRTNAPDCAGDGEDFTHILKRGSNSFIPVTSSPRRGTSPIPDLESQKANTKSITPIPSVNPADHTYPPSVLLGDISISPTTSSWGVGVPSWLKGSPRKTLSGSSGTTEHRPTTVSEVYSSTTSHVSRSSGCQGDMGYSVLETPEANVDVDIRDKFHTQFAFDNKEVLLGCLYIFSRFLAFLSDNSWAC